MTIGKIKRIVLALVLCVSCLLSVSCARNTDSALEALASLSFEDTDMPKAASLYRIVISDTCDSTVANAADTLADGIFTQTGIECAVTYDNVSVPEQQNVVEILLGNVDREAARVMLDRRNRDDYVCGYAYDGSFFIGGRADSATCAAIDKYNEEYLLYATAASLIPEDGGFEYTCEYPLGAATVCGFALDDYVFVCDDNTANVAGHVRKAISDKCGTYPDMAVGEALMRGRKEIVFKIDEDTAQVPMAYITKDNEDIIVRGTDSYALSVAADRFCRMIFDNGGALDVSDELQLSYADARINVLSLAVADSNGDDAVDIAFEIQRNISMAQPEIVMLGGVSGNVWQIINSALPQGYTAIAKVLTDGGYIPVLYKTEVFSLQSESANDSDSVGEQSLTLVHKTNGEKITVTGLVGKSASAKGEHQKKISESIADNTLVLFFCHEYADGSFDISNDKAHVWYNAGVTVGDTSQRHCLVTPTDSFDISELNANVSANGNICSLSFTVRPRYSASFLELTSEDVVN